MPLMIWHALCWYVAAIADVGQGGHPAKSCTSLGMSVQDTPNAKLGLQTGSLSCGHRDRLERVIVLSFLFTHIQLWYSPFVLKTALLGHGADAINNAKVESKTGLHF